MDKKQFELLAPAGSFEGFEAAIGAGADAVYVGGSAFGARAYAKNFSQEELLLAIDLAHIHDKKLYLTVNTLMKNRELDEQLYAYLLPLYEAGLDAVIVQDLGVFSFIRKNFPGMHLHASTQMTVTGPAGMRFLERQGASRVVTARELSLEEISRMHEASGIEIESFIHGALCYSFSGQCLMSSLLGGRSGNRGRCAQPCRLSYRTASAPEKWKGSKELCPLSLKDMCTIELLPEILEAGVYSLKIEGRMKQPQYTAGVTEIYRKYLDRYSRYGAEAFEVEEADRRRLLDIFNRGGSCEGYYRRQNGPEMMAFSNEKKTGNITVELRKAREKLTGTLTLTAGQPARLEAKCRDASVRIEMGEVQEAKTDPMEEARIRLQMEKLGNTEFEWERLDIRVNGRIFVPVKILNECRREAVCRLSEKLLEKTRRQKPADQDKKDADKAPRALRQDSGQVRGVPRNDSREGEKPVEKPAVYVSCETREQALALWDDPEVTGLYLNFDVMQECMDRGIAEEKEVYLSLPQIVRQAFPDGYLSQSLEWLEKGMKGFLVRNLEAYAMLKDAGLAGACVIDHSLYTWNDEATAFWRQEGILRCTAPLELNEKELERRDNRDSEFLIYGYLPVMTSAQCIRKNLYGCDKKEQMTWLKDRYDTVFPAACCCNPWKTETTKKGRFCYNIIYNSIPYGLIRDQKQVKKLGMKALRLSFTIESPQECRRLLEEFLEVYRHDGTPREHSFTRGHFKRGAE